MEPNSPKKIQFAVPLFQSQIAPEAAEQIRKRRPTPASLVILNEHNPPVTKCIPKAKEAERVYTTGHERKCRQAAKEKRRDRNRQKAAALREHGIRREKGCKMG
uniref:Protein phosphatase 1 regulatory inhibitor subunit 1C n=1 Tax=Ailuropoda melanoleuca TaxID=9646 RepID=A0A7N5JXT8_AILME